MEVIVTDAAPQSLGPYSQGIKDDTNVYVSGQGPIDPETGDIVDEDIEGQTVQTLENVAAVLEAGDSSLNQVVKVTVFVTKMDDYDMINEVYSKYMSEPYPARSVVEVSNLPVDIDVEIEVIAEY